MEESLRNVQCRFCILSYIVVRSHKNYDETYIACQLNMRTFEMLKRSIAPLDTNRGQPKAK